MSTETTESTRPDLWNRNISAGNFIVGTIMLLLALLAVVVNSRVQATHADDVGLKNAEDIARVERKVDSLTDRLEKKLDAVSERQSDMVGQIRELNAILKEDGKKR